MADKISIHPKIDSGIQPAAKDFTGVTSVTIA
jgi:hypothetical protein